MCQIEIKKYEKVNLRAENISTKCHFNANF